MFQGFVSGYVPFRFVRGFRGSGWRVAVGIVETIVRETVVRETVARRLVLHTVGTCCSRIRVFMQQAYKRTYVPNQKRTLFESGGSVS